MAWSMAPGQDVELLVHRDADGLERALGGVAAGAAGRRGDGVADELGQLGGGGHRAGGDDGPGDAAGEALVAEGAQEARRGRARRCSLTTSAAVRRRRWSMRMSRGASCR